MTDKEIRLPEGLDVETATDVLREFATTDDAQIIESDALQSLRDEMTEAKEAFAAVLAEESPQSAETLARQDMDALTEPFRDDDGEIDVDTLRQEPQTQTGGGATDPDPDGFEPTTLSLDDREQLRRLKMKRTSFENRGMDQRVDALTSEIQTLAGVDDVDEIDWEVL